MRLATSICYLCIAGIATSPMLSCSQCQCALSQPVANPNSRSVAPNRRAFPQRRQWERICAATRASVLHFFYWNRALAWCAFCRPHLPKLLHVHLFLTTHFQFKCESGSLSLSLSLSLQPRGPEPRKQTPYFGDPRSYITKKNTWFHAQGCLHPWIQGFGTVIYFLHCSHMRTALADSVADMMTELLLDIRV